MRKQIKPSPGSGRISTFYGKHRAVTIVLVAILALAMLIGFIRYRVYVNKFSDKDYATLSAQAESILKTVSTADIKKYETCEYFAGKYESARLYCDIEMITYTTYAGEEQAISLARHLEREIGSMGTVSSHLTEFYKKPYNGSGVAVVTLNEPLHRKQCSFNIYSNDRAKDAVEFLPDRTEDNLIALHFYCSTESREEYFPVTHR